MPRWERELRGLAWFLDKAEVQRQVNRTRFLIWHGLLRPVHEDDWTPFDGAKPAFTEEDADMLLARMDDAEAEIKALQEEAQNARIRDQRTHGRIDGVVRRIAQGLASASDTAMKEVGK